MKLLDKFKHAFSGEKPPVAAVVAPAAGVIPDVPPIQPGKIDLRRLMRALRGGFRLPARTHVYRKRGPKLVLIGHDVVKMPHAKARLHFIHTGMREANEIRRSFRTRQLEARVERAAA